LRTAQLIARPVSLRTVKVPGPPSAAGAAAGMQAPASARNDISQVFAFISALPDRATDAPSDRCRRALYAPF
jgi:hypothetical protein